MSAMPTPVVSRWFSLLVLLFWSAAVPAFSLADIYKRAQELAKKTYVKPSAELPDALHELTYEHYQDIRYRPDRALWHGQALPLELSFFHRGMIFDQAVKINEIAGGKVSEVQYAADAFDFGANKIDTQKLNGLGFAGFRVHCALNTPKTRDEVLVFLGASYFRALGQGQVYGISARGVAIDTVEQSGEEFPRFVEFWIERPAADARQFTVYALLDSPRVTGAYRFLLKPGKETAIDVKARLYLRDKVAKLGLAPLSSMYFFGENQPAERPDDRPEVHDSDGLSVHTGAEEWLWRPLVNPKRLLVTSFGMNDPRGFGLQQRDRHFDSYQELPTRYDQRPGVWVEPSGDWGRGSVHLVELPTPDETNDNVVAYWNPEGKPQPGQELLFSYRQWWGTQMPHGSPLAQVVATRTGIVGIVGQKRRRFSWRFVVDFAGGQLPMIGEKVRLQALVSASRGEIEIASARPLESIGGYRASFDLRPADDSVEPINLWLYLGLQEQPLSETWFYQWTPPSAAERKRYL